MIFDGHLQQHLAWVLHLNNHPQFAYVLHGCQFKTQKPSLLSPEVLDGKCFGYLPTLWKAWRKCNTENSPEIQEPLSDLHQRPWCAINLAA